MYDVEQRHLKCKSFVLLCQTVFIAYYVHDAVEDAAEFKSNIIALYFYTNAALNRRKMTSSNPYNS